MQLTLDNKIALDTNIYSKLGRGDLSEKYIELILGAKTLCLPMVVIAELYGGFYNGTVLEKNIKNLEVFLSNNNVQIIHTSLAVCEAYGRIYAKLKKNGTPIPTNDIWISALCIENGATLLTADGHFKSVDELEFLLCD